MSTNLVYIFQENRKNLLSKVKLSVTIIVKELKKEVLAMSEKKDPKETFGGYLKSLRELRGMSITDLAKLSSVSPSYISRIENGGRRPPKPEILEKIAPHLEIGYMELMVKAGYVTKDADALWIRDEETKELFLNLSEGKKELLRTVDQFDERTIFMIINTIKNIERDILNSND